DRITAHGLPDEHRPFDVEGVEQAEQVDPVRCGAPSARRAAAQTEAASVVGDATEAVAQRGDLLPPVQVRPLAAVGEHQRGVAVTVDLVVELDSVDVDVHGYRWQRTATPSTVTTGGSTSRQVSIACGHRPTYGHPSGAAPLAVSSSSTGECRRRLVGS